MLIECHSCGVEFERGQKRRYCSHMCRVMNDGARLGRCWECGANLGVALLIHLTYEAKIEARRQGDEFAAEHRACRRRYMDREGRDDTPGLFTYPSRRTSGYRQHLAAVIERDNGVCQICRIEVDSDAAQDDDRAPQLDHVVPASDGGTDEIENLRLAHRWCNLARRDPFLWDDDYLIALAARERFSDR